MKESELRFRSYNSNNVLKARSMRKDPTLAERKMWDEFLKNRPLWYKFTRQKPISWFIVDFYCAKLTLAIELDWSIHDNRQEYDQERDVVLSQKYWIFMMRFTNDEILKTPDISYKKLLEKIKEIEKYSLKVPLLSPYRTRGI